MDGKGVPNRTLVGLIGDMAELVARAFFGGLAAAVAMGAAILALSAGAQATPHSAAHPPLGSIVATSASGNKTWSAAPTPVVDQAPAGVGALWARTSRHGSEASRGTDDASDAVQLLLGLVALLSVGAVALAGHRAERIEASHDSMKLS